MSDLEGKVVLVTGTARGCGQVLAEAFAGAGAKVVACDRDAEAGRAGFRPPQRPATRTFVASIWR